MKFDQDNQKGFLKSFVLLGVSIFFLLLNIPGFLDFVRKPISYVYDPITFGGANIGKDIKSGFEIFSEIGDLRNEIDRLEAENAVLKDSKDYVSLIATENVALRDELNLGSVKDEKVLAKVVKDESLDFLHLNVGFSDGVSKGDIVSYGNVYIGMVNAVDEYGCTVVLAQSKNSDMQVLVLIDNNVSGISVDDIEAELSSTVRINGIAVGMGNSINIENVLTDSGIAIGDIVIVNDRAVGKYLILGTISSIDLDPAASTSLVIMEPYMNYNELETVFVSVKGGSND